MSRTTLKRDRFTIVAGWDAPCQHYFASIYTPDDEPDVPFYCTLDDDESDMGGGFADLLAVVKRVEQRVGPLPKAFWDKVLIQDMNVVREVEDEPRRVFADEREWSLAQSIECGNPRCIGGRVGDGRCPDCTSPTMPRFDEP